MDISVLLPVRDAEATVEVAVRSMLEQTVEVLEVLAVDDGSTDDTPAILRRLAREDPRVRPLTAGGRGLVAALNLGWSHARGALMARMDADDVSLPRRLERSVQRLEAEPRLSVVGTGVELFRDDRPVSPNMHGYARWLSSLTTAERARRERFIEAPLCHPSVLMRREAVEACGEGPYRDGDHPEDYELWLRLAAAGQHLACVDEVLFRWRDGPGRATRTDPRYRPDAHLALKATYLVRALGPTRLVIWGATDTGRRLSRHLTARGATLAGFIELDPRKLGQQIHGVPVMTPEQSLALHDIHVLCCVAAKGAREEIRQFLTTHHRVEGEDFTCVA